jgi:hypothetical protein
MRYLKRNEAKQGMTVWLDAGFTCHCAGQVVLKSDGEQLYFDCAQGQHAIVGQQLDDYYIGISLDKFGED